jgi:hypothetical protein
LFQGKRLNDADRATYAFDLFDELHSPSGTVRTSIEAIHAAGLVPLDKGRLRDVLRTAEDRGLGILCDETMEWFAERQTPDAFKPPQQLNFGLGA